MYNTEIIDNSGVNMQQPPNSHFSIKTKIFLIILIPSLLLLLVIAIDSRNLTMLGRSAELILSKNYNSIQTAQKIRQVLEMTRNHILLGLFEHQQDEAETTASPTEIAVLLEFCQKNVTEAGEQDIINDLFRRYDRYQQLHASILQYPTQPSPLNDNLLEFISVTADFIGRIDDLVSINEQAMKRAERETKYIAQKALRYSIGLMIAAMMSTVILNYLLFRHISMPLTVLANTLSSIKEGSGSYPDIPVRTHDEIGFLTSEFNRLFNRLKVYDRENADKLLAEREKVHQAEIAKAKFIADLSHQLKTPMTSLAMSVNLLYEKPDYLSQEKQVTLIEVAKDDCTRLFSLINELVNITRLEVMVQPREKEVLDIEMVIQECIKPLIQQAEEKQSRIELEIEHGIPPVAIDSLRFPWVITNLAGNALRYINSGGCVTLKVHRRGRRIYFQCTDTGIGIDTKYLSRIFERYSQFSEREKSGTIGLGLAIVKEIIEQHGGEIHVESQLHRGTTFTFWIPIDLEEHNNEARGDY